MNRETGRERFAIWLQDHPLFRDTVVTTFLSIIGRSVGFFIPFFIAAMYGVTSQTDCFFLAFSIVFFMVMVVAPTIESSIVPFITESRMSEADTGPFVGQVLLICTLGNISLLACILLFIRPLLRAFTSFDETSISLVQQLIFELSPFVLLITWENILSGVLNSLRRFAVPALAPAARAIVNICVIFLLASSLGVHAIVLGYLSGELVQVFVFIYVLRRLNFPRMRITCALSTRVREFIRVSIFQILGISAVGLNPFIDNIMGSWSGTGAVSILDYANRLYMVPVTLLSRGIMVTLLSHWSDLYYAPDGPARFPKAIRQAVVLVGGLSLAITLFLVIFHKPLVSLVYGYGLSAERVTAIDQVWLAYLVGLVPLMAGFPLNRVYLVTKKTFFLMIVFLVNFMLNILLNYVFLDWFGLWGISLATAVVAWICFFLLWWGLRYTHSDNEGRAT